MLYNKYDKETLRNKLMAEDFPRTTLSFYRYVILENVNEMRDMLYKEFEAFQVFGRIYVAREGINAQISVPTHNFEKFISQLYSHPEFANVDLKIAVEDDGKSFYKLIVRVRSKIVADGLADDTFDVTNVGNHLNAKEFNEAMQQPETIVVDLRNHYESEVGHFKGAILPDADTFRDELPMVVNLLKDQKDKKILLYCTGGIRCEKASAYLKHEGFEDVNQLNGGIIHYARQVKAEGLESKFIGKNFVFDDRMGERITEEIISTCHQCGEPCDTHVNCANDDCHLLFIQCDKCAAKMNGCCTPTCKDISLMPVEKQRELRKGRIKENAHSVYKSRLRPNLREYLDQNKIHI
ncbi:MAG TPA: rhodanese-related sulfurtransferase [Bacteroidia bacterium]|nr:rhodanese-related sulfurtransferase [Bacteroidota bacterium]HQW24038.1 rhodanese-related sulfurtransferase [Bacteroidia bacterium]